METKTFHLADVLSLITNRNLSPGNIAEIGQLIRFMNYDELTLKSFPQRCQECRSSLFEQFPQFAERDMELTIAGLEQAITQLQQNLPLKSADTLVETIIKDWLKVQATKYGNTFAVSPISANLHDGVKNLIG